MVNKKKFKVVRLNSAVFPIIKEEANALSSAEANIIAEDGDDINKENLDADAVIVASAKISGNLIRKMPNCRSITKLGIGTEKIDIDTATEKGIIVINIPDFCDSELADHTLALLLASVRKLFPLDKGVRDSEWKIRDLVVLKRIEGKKLGLIGFGNLARNFIARARILGVKIYAYDPYVGQKEMDGLGVIKVENLKDILRDSDYVVLMLPLTDETYHLIGEKELKMMKSEAILINVARGAIIDENMLYRALKERWIDSAAIDVYEKINPFEEIPSRQYSPLFKLDNIILTPHIASCSVESLIEVKEKAAKETARVLSGRWPENPVNRDVIPRFELRE